MNYVIYWHKHPLRVYDNEESCLDAFEWFCGFLLKDKLEVREEMSEEEMKEIQYIIDRINYIATLPNDQIQGDKPEWVCYNAQEADDIEGMPKYIIPSVRANGNLWRPMRLCNDRGAFAHYQNGTNILMKMYKDETNIVYGSNGLVFDYTEISRLEYLRFYLKISENYVISYNLKEKE